MHGTMEKYINRTYKISGHRNATLKLFEEQNATTLLIKPYNGDRAKKIHRLSDYCWVFSESGRVKLASMINWILTIILNISFCLPINTSR